MAKRYYDGPVSDHYDGEHFFNPGQTAPPPRLRPSAMLRWMLRRQPIPWPRSVPVVPARPAARVDGLRITGVGHSTMLIQVAGRNLLTDPVWSERASPFPLAGPRRVTAPGIRFADLPPIDAVLLSHCHYDHLDLPTLKRLHRRHAPLFAMPLGTDTIVREAIPGARMVVGDWFDRLVLAPGLATTLTPSQHWAARWPSDARRMLWCGHLLETGAASVWFAGDTAYGDGAIFPAIRARLGAQDVALIPIGAYEPRGFMRGSHTNPEEAVRIMRDVGAARALGIHWGTFRLSGEAWDAPRADLEAALDAAGIPRAHFVASEPGRVHEFHAEARAAA